MAKDPEDIQAFVKTLAKDWNKKSFKAAFDCAQTAALYIDISCRMHFKKSTGTLANSFKPALVVRKGFEIRTGVYSALPYAGIRERGGRINVKNAKALAIPMTDKAKNTGSPLNWKRPKLRYINPGANSRPGAAGVFGTRGRKKDSPVTTQYALRYYVDQEGTGYISWALKKAGPEFDKICADAGVAAFKASSVERVK